MYIIGIDLGTSAMKLLLVNERGQIRSTAVREYPLLFPHPGWSEQNPEDWWTAAVDGIHELLEGFDPKEVKGIAAAGQMHGLVALDEKDQVLRPAILWNDSRTVKQVEYLNETIGRSRLSECTSNIAFVGFTAPKILWMKEQEPDLFAKIRHILLPKDYISLKLTGRYCTDYSDASGTLLLDVRNRCWSKEMMQICSVTPDQLPDLYESYETIGTLQPEAAAALGLSTDVTVAAGAGDNAAAAVGCGTVTDGACNLSLGTSGTVFIASDTMRVDPMNALHSFAHANGRYHLLGCILSAASCNQWWLEKILNTSDYSGEQAGISDEMLGRNDAYFLPYLMGERSPLNDPSARGCFLGLRMDTSRQEMTEAVLEGVAFAFRDCLEIARSQGIVIKKSTICGGGAKSPLWRRIMANALGIPLEIPQTEQGPGYGAAILAGVACGTWKDVNEAAERLVRIKETDEPEPELSARYTECYQKWHSLYPALKETFRRMGE
jgi:xylulokinase